MNKSESWQTGLGLLAFVAVCVFASWLGEEMHSPEDYYGGNPSYLQESCPGCDQP